jgi:ribulose-5-phosphate 4-epimerase/fuculose-1-phosphate aldolase
MNNISKNYIKDFLKAAHRVAEYRLVVCGSGNLSQRIDDDHILITPTSSWMEKISTHDVAVCKISDRTAINGKNPSTEIGFHVGIFQERKDVNVVLHFQSPCATTMACQERQIESFSIIPEIPYYIGPVATVPYSRPGSNELAQAVTTAGKKHDMIILRNHGLVTVGKDFDDAIEKAMYFELACKILLKAGGDVQHLSKEAVAEMRQMREKSHTKYC